MWTEDGVGDGKRMARQTIYKVLTLIGDSLNLFQPQRLSGDFKFKLWVWSKNGPVFW